MSQAIADGFHSHIDEAERRLRALPEQDSLLRTRPDGWTRKQVLGHLIDSALNNHQRVVRASLQGEYRGPGYDQDGWVRMHGYEELPWTELVDFWTSQNRLLARVVSRIPADRLEAPCQVGEHPAMTLLALIEDYLRHMRQHLDQIRAEGV